MTNGEAMPNAECPMGSARAGLTLIELLLGVAMTTLIAASVVAILFASTYAASSQDEMRTTMVCHELAAARLNAAVRSSQMILAKGQDYLVLWMADSRTNATPNLSELRRIERDPTSREMRSYKAPWGLGAADDTEYDLATTDFNAVTSALRGTANFPKELWASDLDGWTIALDKADPRQAILVDYQLTVTVGGTSWTTLGTAALRCP